MFWKQGDNHEIRQDFRKQQISLGVPFSEDLVCDQMNCSSPSVYCLVWLLRSEDIAYLVGSGSSWQQHTRSSTMSRYPLWSARRRTTTVRFNLGVARRSRSTLKRIEPGQWAPSLHLPPVQFHCAFLLVDRGASTLTIISRVASLSNHSSRLAPCADFKNTLCVTENRLTLHRDHLQSR